MAAYAALATGLINFRYQSGDSSNLNKSLYLILPGALLLAISYTHFGKRWLESKVATVAVSLVGGVLLVYSFIL